MKKNIKTLAALLIASAAFVACSSDDNIISENQQPANPTGKYTMTINASKGGDGATTRALTIDDSGAKNVLNATWATTENVYVQKGGSLAEGSLQPQEAGTSTTLKGTLSGISIAADDVLTLQFPKSGAISYAGQVGTLADIAANFDYATATVEVASVSATGNITPKAATTTFTNLQAIVKFTLKDKATDAAISATQLVVNDGTNAYIVTPASGTDVIYVAIPGISGQTVTLIATVGDDTYTYEKSGVTFTNGQYYEITVKMTQAPALNLTSPAVGQVIGDDGKNYNYASLPGGVTAVAKICYVSGSDGLALALEDEGTMNWSTAISTCAAHTPAFTGGTWKLATQDEWTNMITAAGGYTALRDGFSSVGGSNLLSNYYWSSTVYDSDRARIYGFYYGDWGYDDKVKDYVSVRACLAWTINTPGLLAGAFKINAGGTQVRFAQGNLQATWNGSTWSWAFATNQWDYIGNAAGNTSINGNGSVSANNVTVDLFGWVGASSTWTGAAQYGISNSGTTNNINGYGNNASEALKSDWGNTIGSGWRTLTKDEWTYLFNTRTVNGGTGSGKSYTLNATVGSKMGVVIYPDNYTGSVYSGSDWASFEAAGCVFLPAAGYRAGASVNLAGSYGDYWSSSPNTSDVDKAYYVDFNSGNLNPASYNYRSFGLSVRLVREVE